MPDIDLVKRRIYQKIDSVSGQLYVREMFDPVLDAAAAAAAASTKASKKDSDGNDNDDDGDGEEAGEEEEDAKNSAASALAKDPFFALCSSEVMPRLVVRPEDNQPQVESSIGSFKQALLHVLEDQMASMDQSYLIELDANLSPTVLVKQLLARLDGYVIQKAARVLRFTAPPPIDEMAGGEEDDVDQSAAAKNTAATSNHDQFADHGMVDELLLGLQLKRRLAAMFKWRRSRASFYCPVALRDSGRIAIGRPEYAAAFLDKVYMLSDEQSLRSFMRNPRPYLRTPQPRAPCKVSVLGAPYAGKTTLCALLAKKYNAHVIDMRALMEPEMTRRKLEASDRLRQDTTLAVVEQIKFEYKEKLAGECFLLLCFLSRIRF